MSSALHRFAVLAALAFAPVALSACGSNTGTTIAPINPDADDPNGDRDGDGDGDHDDVDLDTKDAIWVARTRDNLTLVLYTFKDKPDFVLDVRDGERSPTKAQYKGTRPLRQRSFEVVLSCLNRGSASTCPLGDEERVTCAVEGRSQNKKKRSRLDCGPTMQFEEASAHEVER